MRVGLAAAAGVVSTALGFVTPRTAGFGILIAIGFYVVSYVVARQFLEIPLAKQEKHKIVTQGIWQFTIFFLFVWILLTTVVRG
jgi:protein-S-isoprenylcysteine O-methyltransferase Ste14